MYEHNEAEPASNERPSASAAVITPDVWWGEHGIDGVIWAGIALYVHPRERGLRDIGGERS